jgi:hypothetical protein
MNLGGAGRMALYPKKATTIRAMVKKPSSASKISRGFDALLVLELALELLALELALADGLTKILIVLDILLSPVSVLAPLDCGKHGGAVNFALRDIVPCVLRWLGHRLTAR